MRKIICFAVVLVMVASLISLPVAAETTYGDFTVICADSLTSSEVSYLNGVLTVNTEKDITVKNTDSSFSTTDRRFIAKNTNANVTLDGVNIDAQFTGAAFSIADGSTGNVTVILSEGSHNILKSGTDFAGLQKTEQQAV